MSIAAQPGTTREGSGPTILAGPLRADGGILADYLAGRDLSAFYTGDPFAGGAYARKAAEVDERLDAAARVRVAPAIEPLGDAAGRVERILSGDGYFVTTGQQPALFGGPLYTLYKALSAIRLAEALEQRLERPVLALFWIGADDHDWDEANHATILDADDYPVRLAVEGGEETAPVALSRRVWGEDITRVVREMEERLPRSAFSGAVAEHLRQAYVPTATVADSFTATLRLLLGGHRIALVSSASDHVRRAAAPVLRHEAEETPAHTVLNARQTERLVDAGYAAQVPLAAGASNLMLDSAGRERLMRTRAGWATRRSGRLLAHTDLMRLLESEPDRFSPNVLLRPVVESALLPTIAYVGGPAEVAYFAQIGCLFRAHGILPPVVVPRHAVTIVDPVVKRLLDRVRLDSDAFRRPLHELVSERIRGEVPPDVEAALATVRAGVRDEYERLAAAAERLDPTLRGSVISSRNHSLREAHRAERRILRALKRREHLLVEQLRRVSAHLHPAGAPQERTLGPLPLVARYGPDIVERIARSLDIDLTRSGGWAGPDCHP